MSLQRLLNQPLELHKVSLNTVDEYGNAIAGDFAAPVPIVGYLELTQSVETVLDRDTVVSEFKVWLPADSNVSAFDRIVFNGQTFEVDGSPWQVWNPRVQVLSHLIARLKVVE